MSIILSTKEKALYEFQLCFDSARFTLKPFRFIMKLKEEQKLNQSYLSEDLMLSLLLIDKKYGPGSN